MVLFKALTSVRVFCSLALALSLLVAPASAQQQEPLTTPRQDQEIIRINTELVQTDVTVLDKQGRFISGLQPQQFELTVDGKLQPIAFFEQVTAGSSREAAIVAASKRPPANASLASTSVTADRGRTTLFFVDDLHLSFDSMKRTRDTLLSFVNEIMGSKDQALIATASGQLNFLQQLTGNKEVLRKAIEGLTYRSVSAGGNNSVCTPSMSDYQAVAIENGDRDVLAYLVDLACPRCPPDTSMSNNAVFDNTVSRPPRSGRRSGTSGTTTTGTGIRAATSSGGNPRSGIERTVKMCARIIARQATQVTLNTLGSLESLIRTAAPIPERKLVVLISDGFFINFISSTNAYDMRRVTDAALRSGVVIYTVDAKGLVAGGPTAQTAGFDLKGRLPRMTSKEVTASQDALNALAADTGGQAWRNSNDLMSGVRQAIKETSTYYLLAWRPDVPQGKDRFRRIKVRIKDRLDLMVRVRGGFFAEEPTVKDSTAASSKPKTTEQYLLELIRAAYPIRSLPVVLSAGHMSVSGGMAVAASMLMEADSLGADPKAAQVDVMGVLVNKTGNVVSSVQQHLTAPLAEAAAQRNRMVYTMQFPVPAPGLYQVRVAARESKTGRGGSATQWVEIPDISKGEFGLSSIFLSEVASSAGGAYAQKASISPDRGFARTARLRFQAQIYNAALVAGRPDLTLELQLLNNVQSLITTPASPVSTEGVMDLARVPLTGEFPLGVLPAGQYVMRITVMDRVAKKTITQQVDFRVQ